MSAGIVLGNVRAFEIILGFRWILGAGRGFQGGRDFTTGVSAWLALVTTGIKTEGFV